GMGFLVLCALRRGRDVGGQDRGRPARLRTARDSGRRRLADLAPNGNRARRRLDVHVRGERHRATGFGTLRPAGSAEHSGRADDRSRAPRSRVAVSRRESRRGGRYKPVGKFAVRIQSLGRGVSQRATILAVARAMLTAAIGTLCLVHAVAAEPEPRRGASLAGHWVGDIPLGGGQTSTLALDLDQCGARWVGQFDVDALGVQDYPIHVELDADRVTLGLSAAEAEFQGTIDGNKMSGTLDLKGQKIDVQFQRTGRAELSPQFLQLEAAADDSTLVEALST